MFPFLTDKTIAVTTENPSKDVAQKVARQIAPQMQELQVVLQNAQYTVQSQAKRDVDTVAGGTCSQNCLLGKVNGLVSEVGCTVKMIVKTLGAGE